MMTLVVYTDGGMRWGIEYVPLDTPMVLYAKTFLPGWSFEILSVEYHR